MADGEFCAGYLVVRQVSMVSGSQRRRLVRAVGVAVRGSSGHGCFG